MRLPLSKAYRAFPELDKFSDERCEAYIRAAMQRRRVASSLFSLGFFVIALPLVLIAFSLVVSFIDWIDKVVRRDPNLRTFEALFEGLAVVCAVVALATGPVLFLLIRDGWLRWAIRRQLTTSECPSCRYQLLGLIAECGRVQCPECGTPIDLAELGIAPEDLLPPTQAHAIS